MTSLGTVGADGALLALGLGAARTLPLTWLVPALGGPRVAPRFRVGLGVLLAVLCLPVLLPVVQATGMAAMMSPLGWLIVLAREALVGVTVGLCTGAVFSAAESAGRLAGVWSGANLAGALSSGADDGGSPIGDLYLFLVVVSFLELGGLGVLIGALARSYDAVPLAGLASPGGLRPAAELVVLATARLLETAVGLAAPVLVVSWLLDVVLGLVGRAVPQLPLSFMAMPARALLGLGTVLVGLGAVDAAWTAGFPAWAALIERAFAVWRPS